MAFKITHIQPKSHCCFTISCENVANEKNQCSHNLAPQNSKKFCYWHNYLIGNVASKFQVNAVVQAKDIHVFMNLVEFLAFPGGPLFLTMLLYLELIKWSKPQLQSKFKPLFAKKKRASNKAKTRESMTLIEPHQ